MCVVSISIFMGCGKRRNELKTCVNDYSARPVLQFYTISYLDKVMYFAAAQAIFFYALWSFSSAPDSLAIWSVPFVVFAFIRYSYIVEIKNSDGDPVNLILKDIPLLLLGAGVGLINFIQLYGKSLMDLL